MARIEISKKKRDACKLPKDVSMKKMYAVLLILPISMLVFGLLSNTPREILVGIGDIYSASDILITDYFVVANTGAAFVNAAVVMLLNLLLLYKLKLKPNGIIISAVFLLGGFAFMGKNPFNIWPFYLGGYVYCKYHHIPYKNVVVINMLSTALSPLSSFVTQAFGEHVVLALICTACVSGFVGFIMPTISSHMLSTHLGYSLYNMGAATGFVGMLIYAILTGFGFEMEHSSIFFEEMNVSILIFFVVMCIMFIIIGYVLNERTFKGYKYLLTHTGRLVTDMIKQDGFGLALVNMGALGLLCIIYILLVGGVMNGPVLAAIFTVMGFGTFGKHPRNVLPIIIGVTLGVYLMNKEVSITILVISALFGTTLAPIAGSYGVFWGILAGMLHAALVLNIGATHGGIALYNNGLSGGIIAALLIPTIDAFKREKRNETRAS